MAEGRRAAVLTVSDRASRGQRVDTAGPAVVELLRGIGFAVEPLDVVPDEEEQIAEWLRRCADDLRVQVAVTTGGTGLSPRDRTPQATQSVIDYRVDGIAEAMRAASIAIVPMAMLSRAVAGVRGRTLIINVPGSERGARENLEVVLPVLRHAADQLGGEADHA